MTTVVHETKKKFSGCIVVVLDFLIICMLGAIISIIFLNNTSYSISDNFDNNNDIVIYRNGFYYDKLSYDLKHKITGITYPVEFDFHYNSISYDDLRYVRVKYYDFNGYEHEDGEMIVNKLVAQDVVEIFYKLYLSKYPINKISLVDEYNGDDELSMEDNNSSCFNYRIVENIDRLSWHAFGLAIDINPLYNPYVIGNKVFPSSSSYYVDRTLDFVGKIDYDDTAYKLFTEYGWKWGGDFEYVKDYQHFYKEVFDDKIRERR